MVTEIMHLAAKNGGHFLVRDTQHNSRGASEGRGCVRELTCVV